MALPRQPKKPGKDESLPSEVRELVSLVAAYARQETIDPLKALGRWVAYGLAGALLVGVGFVLLGVGILRAVQTEANSHLAGNLSWVPYLIVVIYFGVVIVFAVRRMSHGPGSEEP